MQLLHDRDATGGKGATARAARRHWHCLVSWLIVALGAPLHLLAQTPADLIPLVGIRLVASDTLRDLALTATQDGRPTIYYNPELMAYVGPRLTRFFIAHEYGHIANGHTGGAMGPDDPQLADGRRAQELEADCYAANRLAVTDPEAVEAAIRFFTITGAFRFDNLHPSGTERAARIALCASTRTSGDRASHPVTVLAAPVSVTVCAWEANVWIDHVPVGTISNLRVAAGSLTVRALEPGPHEYTVVLRSYYLDETMQLVPVGVVEGGGTVVVQEGKILLLDWRPGERPSLGYGER